MPVRRTATRTVPRRTPFDLVNVLKEYLLNRYTAERAGWLEGQGKGSLMDYIQVAGDEVEGGHREVYLDEPLPFTSYKAGKPVAKDVTGIRRQKRVSTPLNEERTMALLEELKLTAECTEQITVLNEDAVLAANYRGQISDQQLAALYDEKITYAFILITEDG